MAPNFEQFCNMSIYLQKLMPMLIRFGQQFIKSAFPLPSDYAAFGPSKIGAVLLEDANVLWSLCDLVAIATSHLRVRVVVALETGQRIQPCIESCRVGERSPVQQACG